MNDRPVLITNTRSKTTASCLKTSRMVRASTLIARLRDLNTFCFCNDTGYHGHPATTPATGSFQA